MAEDKETPYPLLCFDSETTNHGELLELSVFDIHGNEVYHRYFKPRAKKWPTDIHHITPEMVADCSHFSEYRKEIRQLLNSTRYLVGCALSNDISNLRRHGVRLEEGKYRIFEIQNWYWLLNDATGRQEKQQTGLVNIAGHYGLSFGDEQAHSATADTRLTLESFKALVHDFTEREDVNLPFSSDALFSAQNHPDGIDEALKQLSSHFDKAYMRAMQVYRMNNSAGFINVLKREQGYSLKYSRLKPTEKENLLFSVSVADRVGAEISLREHFEPIQVKGYTGIYDMTESDFEYIRQFKNSIDLKIFLERESSEKIKKQTPLERARKTIASKKEIETTTESQKKNTQANKRKAKQLSKSAPKNRKRKTTDKNKNNSAKGRPKSKTRAATHAMRTAKRAKQD